MTTEGEESSVGETQGVKRPDAPLPPSPSFEESEEKMAGDVQEEDEVQVPEMKKSRVEETEEGEGEGESEKRASEEPAPMLTLGELLDGLNSRSAERADECLERFMRVLLAVLQHQRARASGRVSSSSSSSTNGTIDAEAGEELVHAYLRGSPQVNELLGLWRRAEPSGATARLVVSVLGLLLPANVFADTRPVSGFVARTVTRTRLKALLQLMGDGRYAHVVPALRLLGGIVALGPASARDLFQRFEWRAAAVVALPGRRARAANAAQPGFDHTQHVRTHYARFCLAFLRTGDAALVQAVLAADTVLAPLLDGVAADPAPLLREILGTVARCAVRPPAVPRRLKLRLLSPTALDRLAAILSPRHQQQHPYDHDECAKIATSFLEDCFAALASDSVERGVSDSISSMSATGGGEIGSVTSSASMGEQGFGSGVGSGSCGGNANGVVNAGVVRNGFGNNIGNNGYNGNFGNFGNNETTTAATAAFGESNATPEPGTGTLTLDDLMKGVGGKKGTVLFGLARALCASGVVSAGQRRLVAALLHHRPALGVPFFRWLVLPDAALGVPWLAATALVLDVLAVLPVAACGAAPAPPPAPVLALVAEHTLPLRRAAFARALSYVQPPLVLLRALDVLVALLRRCQRALAGVRARGAAWAPAEAALKSLLKARLPSLQGLLAVHRHCAAEPSPARDLVRARSLAALALALQTFPELIAEDNFHSATLLSVGSGGGNSNNDSIAIDFKSASPLTQYSLLRVLTTAPDFCLARPRAGAPAPAPAFAAVGALALARAHPALARAAFAALLRTLRSSAGLFAEPTGALQFACWVARCNPADSTLLCSILVDALRLEDCPVCADGNSDGADTPQCTSVVLLKHLLTRAGIAIDADADEMDASDGNSKNDKTASTTEQARALVLRIVPDLCLFAPQEVKALLGRCRGDVAQAALAAAQKPDDYDTCVQRVNALTHKPAELLLPHAVPDVLRFVRLAQHLPPGAAPAYVQALTDLLSAAQKVRHRVNEDSGNSQQQQKQQQMKKDQQQEKKQQQHQHFYSSGCLLCSALCYDDVVFRLVTAFADASMARLCAPLLPRLVGAMAPCSGPRAGAYLARVVDALLPLAGAPAKQPLTEALVTCLGNCPGPVRRRFVNSCMDTICAPVPTLVKQEQQDVKQEQIEQDEDEQHKQHLAILLLRTLKPGMNLALLMQHEAYAAALLHAAIATPDVLYDVQLHRLLVRDGAPVSFARCTYALLGPALEPLWLRYATAAVQNPRARARTAPAVAACVRRSPRVAAAVLDAWRAQGLPVTVPHITLVPALAAWRGASAACADGIARDVEPLFVGEGAEQLLTRAFPVLQRAPDPAAAVAFMQPFARGPFARDFLARLESDEHFLLALTPATVAVLAHFIQLAKDRLEVLEKSVVETKANGDDDENEDGNSKMEDDHVGETTTSEATECKQYIERALIVLLRRMAARERPMTPELADAVSAVLVTHGARLPARQLRGKDEATSALWRGAVDAVFAVPRAQGFRALACAVQTVFAHCPQARRRHRLAALQETFAPHLAEYADAPADARARFFPALAALLQRLYALEPALCAAECACTAVMPALARAYTATTSRADRATLAVLRRMDGAGCPLDTVGFAWGNLAWSIAHGTGGDLVQSLLDPASGMIDPDVMARTLENYPFHRCLSSGRGGRKDGGDDRDGNTTSGATADGDETGDSEQKMQSDMRNGDGDDGKDGKDGKNNSGIDNGDGDEDEIENEMDGKDDTATAVYDPVYLIPVLLRVTGALPGESVRSFVESGCLQFVVLALSSPDGQLRQAAYAVLARVYGAVQRSAFADRRETLLLLNVLRNSVGAAGARLPLTATAFLVRCASVLRRPDHALYTAVSRYLLARPALALGRVPMYPDALLQTDPRRVAAHRVWLLRSLAATAAAPSAAQELRVWHAARLLDALCAEHANPACDRASRALVETVVARVLAHWAHPPTAPRAALCAQLLRWLTSVQPAAVEIPVGNQLVCETSGSDCLCDGSKDGDGDTDGHAWDCTSGGGGSYNFVSNSSNGYNNFGNIVGNSTEGNGCSETFAEAVISLATRDSAMAQRVAPDLVAAAAVLLRAGRTAQGLAVLGAVAAVAPPLWQPPGVVALLAAVLARAVAANDVAAAQQAAAALCALVPPEQARPPALSTLLRRVAEALPRGHTRRDIKLWLGDEISDADDV